tara:strand:+ start:2527 stop:3360 length:834 start_codon:yes stop_codon:yes gene_type:complete
MTVDESDALLCANAVSYAYDSTPVISDVTITARPGDCIGLLGPNGSGKTTLLHLLAGLMPPSSGNIKLNGIELHQLERSSVARQLALVPQETVLAFDYSVNEVVLMGRYAHLHIFAKETQEDLDIVKQCLLLTGTSAFADRRFSTLSGGEKQRVVIASALAQLIPSKANPVSVIDAVLLLDEPTTSLDLRYQLLIAEVLKTVRQKQSVTLVLSTHDPNFAAELCDQLILLREGAIIASGPTKSVLTIEHLRELYGINTEITIHHKTGQLLVVPLKTA